MHLRDTQETTQRERIATIKRKRRKKRKRNRKERAKKREKADPDPVTEAQATVQQKAIRRVKLNLAGGRCI